MKTSYVLRIAATRWPGSTWKYSVEFAASLRELVVAVGFNPNSTEQIESLWTATRTVFALNAED
jgi:hypothetical protein